VNESFDYELLEVIPGGIRYRDREARHYFAEGFGMHANPYFNLPLDGKRELFIIAPELNLDVIVNTSVLYYHWVATCSKWGYLQLKDKTNLVTEDGKQELIDRIKKLLTVTLLSWSISQEFDQQ
jgi:hypothetical protein